MKKIKQLFKKIISYFSESRDELRKVVWPTRSRVLTMTVTVLVLVVVISLYLGVADYIFSKMLTYLVSLRK